MSAQHSRKRLEMEALIVGYAMSRLDQRFLECCNSRTWKDVFHVVGERIGVPPASLKNLRDEFDPYHDNRRRGWHKRPLRPSRLRVMGDLCEVSDDSLIALVQSLLERSRPEVEEAVDALLEPRSRVYNVAERVMTGRLAERFFVQNCSRILNLAESDLIDLRDTACGYDFGLCSNPNVAIEVKGIKNRSGPILFTDREWTEARRREEDYWLVVIGNLSATPTPKYLRNPSRTLQARCRYITQVSTVWTSSITFP